MNNAGFQQWLSTINAECGRFAARRLAGNFVGEIESGYASGLKLSTVTAANVNLYRTEREIRSGNDAWFYTVFQLAGEAAIEQGTRQTTLSPGDITVVDASRPCSIFWTARARQVSLLLPRHLLEHQLAAGAAEYVPRLDKTQPVVQLSHRLLQESMNSLAMSESESGAALEAIACLLRPALRQREAQPSRRDRLFEKVTAMIDEHIQSDSLRPAWLAKEMGMSLRSLYRLFADRGLVVAQYIRHRRLDLCASALRSAADEEKLAGIGYSWGFGDHSHFSTAFRQRFGVSPGEYRRRYR
ncbi:transcriptional regulator FeaR [Pluralibacter gergoviae]|uniref:transcriptional regulator FeaR n=1 Tax=Pluralibacter gergoviae TaxID=61647 RepID=UPI0008DBFA2A|nr:transcriptional regulator FeaR [Pluralibacter gergoviae]OHY66598.1 transcriptional regulator FeaR [Pluralibacter gergoviae]